MNTFSIIQTDELKSIIIETLKDFFGNANVDNQTMNNQSDGDRLLTRDEVCKYLHINPSTLWRLEKKEGLIHAKRIGHRCFYDMRELKSLLASNDTSNSQNNPVT